MKKSRADKTLAPTPGDVNIGRDDKLPGAAHL